MTPSGIGPLTPDALLDSLLASGIDPRAIERARLVAAETGQRVDAVMVQLGLVSERQLAETAAVLLGTVVVTPDRYPLVLPDCAALLTVRFLRGARALPLADDDGVLVVALADPLDSFVPAAIAAATGRTIRVEVAVSVELEAALNRLLPDADQAENAGDEAGPLEDDAERLKDMASEAPVIRLVNQIIGRAVETGASDIHIEPFEDALRIRYRYDGVLQEADNPPLRMAAAIISRVKIMARLDIAERRLPQDGRIRLAVRGQDVDFRVSTVASMHGETVVLRVLDRSAVAFDWGKLGLAPAVVQRLATSLELPNGIVLVTGPTGSGKTTTLYTGLLALNAITRKVITIEDPVEYQLRGINQIQVRPQIGLTFANLLRAILRQDPDVIMVGEIRDLETAQIAVQSALTGHLVLSTLHTNSAAATITRLRDMGLEDYLITAVLRGVLAQRLVRRLCLACRRQAPAPPELVQRFSLDQMTLTQPHGEGSASLSQSDPRSPSHGDTSRSSDGDPPPPPRHGPASPGHLSRHPASDDPPIMLWHPVGCPSCRGTGFRGRQAIAEFLIPDDTVARLIFSRADHTEIERAAIAGGMVPMFRAGIAAALAGSTTIEEVVRGIQADA